MESATPFIIHSIIHAQTTSGVVTPFGCVTPPTQYGCLILFERWHQLFSGTDLTQAFISNKPLSKAQRRLVADTAHEWRQRLIDIS